MIKGIEGELAAGGRSWERWQKQVAPFHAAVRKKLKSAPPAIKALPGQDGFLFYRAALDYVVGGDLEKQPRKKNPVPVIKQWKDVPGRPGRGLPVRAGAHQGGDLPRQAGPQPARR